jgi:hypothetical protein
MRLGLPRQCRVDVNEVDVNVAIVLQKMAPTSPHPPSLTPRPPSPLPIAPAGPSLSDVLSLQVPVAAARPLHQLVNRRENGTGHGSQLALLDLRRSFRLE